MKNLKKYGLINIKLIITFILVPMLFLKIGEFIANVAPIPIQQPSFVKFVFFILFICFLYHFLRSYLQYFFRSGRIAFPFVLPKRLVFEGIFLKLRHPVFFTYSGLLLSFLGMLDHLDYIIYFAPTYFLIAWIYFKTFQHRKLSQIFGPQYANQQDKIKFILKKREPMPPSLTRLFVQLILNIVIKKLYPVHYKGVENIPDSGGVLFICNHLSYPDPFFISGGIHRNIRFLTTAEVYKKPLNRLFFRLMGSVPIKRFTRDPAGIRNFFKIIQKGYAVGYFPEGKRSWTGEPSDYPKGVYRLLKRVKVPIIPVSIAGFYALWPRWANKMRRAKTTVRFHPPIRMRDFSSPSNFLTYIKPILHNDEKNYTAQILTRKSINQGLANLLWRCPICGVLDSIIEDKQNKIHCSHCHITGKYNRDNTLTIMSSKAVTKKQLPDWYSKILEFPFNKKEYSSRLSYLYMGNFPHIKRVDKGTIHINPSKIVYVGEKKYEFPFNQIKQLHTEGNKTLHFITHKKQIQIKFLYESPLKWEKIYYMLLKSQEEKRRYKV